jgi:hypothetical protein
MTKKSQEQEHYTMKKMKKYTKRNSGAEYDIKKSSKFFFKTRPRSLFSTKEKKMEINAAFRNLAL